MFTFKFVGLGAILLAPFATSALRLEGYASTTCQGSYYFCDVGPNVCCGPFPDGYGYSAAFPNLPVGAHGLGFRQEVCTNQIFDVTGPAARCPWNGAGAIKALDLRWTFPGASTPSTPVITPIPNAERSGAVVARKAARDAAGCALPSGFGYHDEDGNLREIKVPEGDAQKVVELHATNNYGALREYKAY